MPSWWRLRKLVEQRYDFTHHSMKPALSVVLSDLAAEHETQAALSAARIGVADRFGADDAEVFLQSLQRLREAAQRDARVAAFHTHLMKTPDPRGAVEELQVFAETAKLLAPALDELLADGSCFDLDRLGEIVRDLRENSDSLTELLPLLQEMTECEPAVAQCLRSLPLPADSIEHAVAMENLERIHAAERWLARFDAAALARHATRIARSDQELLEVNAQTMRAGVRRRFRENAQLALRAVSQLDARGKLFKKTYSAGRRELEHEFGKSMRFKSIRELASANSGQVVRDMKPVWLMSPLSVSDTLPLTPDLFDVVIFDEASQIPVEEAVPALYRASQVIIVGDEMQLPPTDFFSSARGDEEDTLDIEDEGERVSVVLDADSLLHQGARNLPATLLAWHYRSRSECLIGYSNAAFYAGNLFTIPDRSIAAGSLAEIAVQPGRVSPELVVAHTSALLDRAVSFHSVRNSPYVNQRNVGEAQYIAQLVRELLSRNTGKSIGIVAFSQAQQSQIESALDSLAANDSQFATQLEAETTREDDDQFVGLFIKNLENVQGDERDIIILSICYGPGPDGRMLMNFGPINQRGGEKRLNVIFSRARHHMAVISSIRAEAITNDNNTGAAALKHFLRYAEHLSAGRARAAQQVLQGLNALTRAALRTDDAEDCVVKQLATALRGRGHEVDEQVGQSRFRCDLALRAAGEPHYSLAILIDTTAHYVSRDVFERFVSRPRILQAFGWNLQHVLSSDWLQDREGVLRRIERALRQIPDEVEATPEPAETAEKEQPEPKAILTSNVPGTALASAGAATESTAPVLAVVMRRFEFIAGESSKFWQIGRNGTDVTISWGRIGTKGQTQIKQLADAGRAEVEMEKLLQEKLRKGYREVSAAS
jgi:predicted DNA-binding WGR domain protein